MQLLYTILFALMMLIDWVRGSQPGAIWEVAVNCVGVLFGIIILTLLPRAKQRRNVHAIWWAICVVVAGVYFISWHVGRGYWIWLSYFTAVLNVAVIGSILVSLSWTELWRDIKSLQMRKKCTSIIWIVMMLYMSLSPMKSVWTVWFLVLFGIYYMTPVSEQRKVQLQQAILNGMIAGFYMIQIWAYGFRPYDVVRYTGAYMNANMNALMYLMTYMALLVKLYNLLYKKNKWRVMWLLYYAILLAGMWGFMSMTGCRTAILIALGLTFVFGVAVFVRNYSNGVSYARNICRVGIVGAVFPVLVSIVFVACYATVRYLPCILHHPVWLEMEYAEWKVHSFDPWDSYKYIEFEELLDEIKGRMPSFVEKSEKQHGILLASSEAVVSDSVIAENVEDKYESIGIRKQIYMLYLQNLNWSGHALEEGYFQIGENYHAYHAQNVWIQIAFYYGIPAGVLLLVLTAMTGIRCLVGALSNISDVWKMFALLTWITFFGFGAMECVWYPGQMILFLIFFTQKDLGKG